MEQFTALAATGAGKRADLEQAQCDLGNLESEFLAADATESAGQAQIAKSEADLAVRNTTSKAAPISRRPMAA